MGLNNEHSRRIVFDLETAPIDGAATYLEPVSAPSNYKDEAKIAAYIAEATAAAADKCSLDPDLCRIVALGWQVEGDESPTVRTCEHEDEERDTINEFWSWADNRHLVGFNCLAFDLPVLLRRGLYLDALRPGIQIDKYKHPQVTDLQMVLSFNGTIKLHGLAFYCKRFGIDVPDTITGADIGHAVKDGRWSEVRGHCHADILKTAAVAARVGLFPRMTAPAVF